MRDRACLLSVFVIFLMFAGSALAASENIVSVNYSVDTPSAAHQTLKTGKGGGEEVFDVLFLEDCPNFNKPGHPSLPLMAAKILIPQDSEFVELKVIPGERVKLEGEFRISPAQNQYPLGMKSDYKVVEPLAKIYESNDVYPSNLFSDVKVQRSRGFQIVFAALHPVQYYPESKTAWYFKTMTVRVVTKPRTDKEEGLMPCRMLSGDMERIQRLADNPELISGYAANLTPWKSNLPKDSYDYVIISNDEFINSTDPYNLQMWQTHKNQRGISSNIISTAYIYANYAGEDDAAKIRAFIQDAYASWGVDYILLVGDGDGEGSGGSEGGDIIIPHRGLWSDTDYMTTDSDIASDMYYANLDDPMDGDGDGTYGERNDGPGGGEIDLLAEVYVGRLAVDSIEELHNHLYKLVAYETTAANDPYLHNAIMMGELLWYDPTYGGDYKDEIKDGADTHGYTTVGFPQTGDNAWTVTTLYDRDLPAEWTASESISAINSDTYSVINHLGHCNVDYMMKFYNPDADALTNGKYFFVYSQGCLPGSFDNRTDYEGSYEDVDCISEHITNYDQNGAFCCVANSRYGWGDHESTNGSSQYFDRQFFDALFGEEIQEIGRANADSKEDNIPFLDYGANRWCYFELNVIGCPQTKIGGGVSSLGTVDMDKNRYKAGDTIAVTVMDLDLNEDPGEIETTTVTITTAGGDSETLVLTETAIGSSIFQGTIPVGFIKAVEDGVVQGDNDELITATYIDADDGAGGADIPREDTAHFDYVGPAISNVQMVSATDTQVVIHWLTDEPSTSALHIGLTIPPDITVSSGGLTTDHTVVVDGLTECSAYFFSVESADEAGNATLDDNAGVYYAAGTYGRYYMFDDDFEGPAQGWTHYSVEGGIDEWHTSEFRSHSATHSRRVGGQDGGEYASNENAALVSPEFELTGVEALEFWEWYATESCCDELYVEITTDGGSVWNELAMYKGLGESWAQRTIDLSGYTGIAQIRFRLDSDSSITAEGWYIDDVKVSSLRPCHAGAISLDRDTYICDGDTIEICVWDVDLNTDPGAVETLDVEISSDAESFPETVTLTENGVNSSEFLGTISTTTAAASSDGLLSLENSDNISALYHDVDTGAGSPADVYDYAKADCIGPVISNVAVSEITGVSSVITWETDEPADSKASYFMEGSPPVEAYDPAIVTYHSLPLADLESCTDYIFSVISSDVYGNETIDDNGGAGYTFKTYSQMMTLFEDFEDGAPGWTHAPASGAIDEWHISEYRSFSATHSYHVGGEDGFPYQEYQDAALYSPIFDVAGPQTLYFREWRAVEDGWDFAYVEVTKNGGASWDELAAYDGESGDWVEREFDLSGYSDETVQLRFRLDSDSMINEEGWYIDDVIIVSEAIPCDPALSFQGFTKLDVGVCSDGDDFIDGGEEFDLTVTIKNIGGVAATNVVGTISSPNMNLVFTDPVQSLGDIGPAGGTGQATFRLFASNDTTCMEPASIIFDFVADGGAVESDSRDIVLETDYETDVADWTWTGSAGEADCVHYPITLTDHWNYSDRRDHTGFDGHSWYQGVDGFYLSDEDCGLEFPSLSLAGGMTSVLTYFVWYHSESSYDGAWLEISADDGETWTGIAPAEGYTDDTGSVYNNRPCYGGESAGWEQGTISLGVWAGQDVLIRVHWYSDGSITYEGFYIDDIRVTNVGAVVEICDQTNCGTDPTPTETPDVTPTTGPTETPPPTVTATPEYTATPGPHDGDVDRDGAVNPLDSYLALQIYLGLDPPGVDWNAADFCPRPYGDGAVDPMDAYGIVKEYLGYEDPCE